MYFDSNERESGFTVINDWMSASYGSTLSPYESSCHTRLPLLSSVLTRTHFSARVGCWCDDGFEEVRDKNHFLILCLQLLNSTLLSQPPKFYFDLQKSFTVPLQKRSERNEIFKGNVNIQFYTRLQSNHLSAIRIIFMLRHLVLDGGILCINRRKESIATDKMLLLLDQGAYC